MAFAGEGDGVGFATESYAASALYATLANLSGARWRIRRASLGRVLRRVSFNGYLRTLSPSNGFVAKATVRRCCRVCDGNGNGARY